MAASKKDKPRPTGTGKKRPRRKKKADPADRIIDAALELSVSLGWRRLTLAAIAEETGLDVADVRAQFPHKAAILQGLDKVTARISTIEAPLGETVVFGTLRIVARACHKRPPEEPPESSAFLDIVDLKPGQAPEPLFTGWMFASSPALSALEHPVYDVWVVDCMKASNSSADSSGR